VVLAVCALAAWLDPDRCVLRAEFGGGPIGIIIGIGSFLGGLFGRAAPTFSSVLLNGLKKGILDVGQALTDFIREVWKFLRPLVHALAHLWHNVLRPFLDWARRKYLALTGWLKRTLAPLIRLIDRLRKEWQLFYTRFLRPILDTIDAIRAGLRILGDLGVGWARTLDRWLGQAEDVITENYRRILGYINEARDILDAVVTPGRLFQQIPFLRTLDRDAGFWIRGFWNKQVVAGQKHGSDYDRGRDYPLDAPHANGKELAQFYRGEPNRMDGDIPPLVALWRQAAGIDPDFAD